MLEIGPGEYNGAKNTFKQAQVFTMDNQEGSGADIFGDITRPFVRYILIEGVFWKMAFDAIICADVLEHVTRPWDAIRNIEAALKPGGFLALSTPLNFRIHGMGGYDPCQGPPPDYWRFTEPGLRLLLRDFEIIEFDALESDRGGFPIHYNVIARKK